MDFDFPPEEPAAPAANPRAESAEALREQAASCRRLALQARTRAGKKGLEGLGDHFDERARQLDPMSERR